MKKVPAVDPMLLAEFEKTLNALPTADDVDEILLDIEDIPSGGDEEYLINKKTLPKEIPADVRAELIAKAREAYRIMNEVQDILGELSRVANRINDEKEAAEEAAKPHCETCGHVLPMNKKNSKKRR